MTLKRKENKTKLIQVIYEKPLYHPLPNFSRMRVRESSKVPNCFYYVFLVMQWAKSGWNYFRCFIALSKCICQCWEPGFSLWEKSCKHSKGEDRDAGGKVCDWSYRGRLLISEIHGDAHLCVYWWDMCREINPASVPWNKDTPEAMSMPHTLLFTFLCGFLTQRHFSEKWLFPGLSRKGTRRGWNIVG